MGRNFQGLWAQSLIVINNGNIKHLSDTHRLLSSVGPSRFLFLYPSSSSCIITLRLNKTRNLSLLQLLLKHVCPLLYHSHLLYTYLVSLPVSLEQAKVLGALTAFAFYSYLAPPFILVCSNKVRLPFSKFSEPSFTLTWFRLSWFSTSLALRIGPSCWWSTKWLPKKKQRTPLNPAAYCYFTVTVNVNQFSYSFKFTWKKRKVNTADLLYLFFWLLLGISAFVLLLLNQIRVREALELKERLTIKAYKHNEPRATWASDKQPFLCYKVTHSILALVCSHKTELHWARWEQLMAWGIHLIVQQWILFLLCISKSTTLMLSRQHYKMVLNVKGCAPAVTRTCYS